MSASQIAEIVCCNSIPGYWVVQVRYINDAHQARLRMIRVGPNASIYDGEYFLWKSRQHNVEAKFEDYTGTVLVPCPEVVSI